MSSRLDREGREQKKKTLIKYSLLILITLIAIGLLYRVGQNLSTLHNKSRLETVVPAYGCLEDKLQGEGMVLRSETIIMAPAKGRFENVLADKERVPRGVLVGYYISSGKKISMRAPAAGIFTRQVDGLESALQDIKLASVGPEVFKYQALSNDVNQEFNSGQGVYKIVNNHVPSQLLVHFPLEGLKLQIAKQQVVKISVDGKPLGEFIVLAYKKDFKELIMILESNDFQESLLNHRLVKVELILNSGSGYLVPEKSLVKKGKEKGIYCTVGEDILFKAVKVLDLKDDITVVEGLNPTDMVIINPEEI